MKKLSRLNEKIVPGIPANEMPPDIRETHMNLVPTYRQMFSRLAVLAKPKDDDESIMGYQLGLKIRSAEGDILDVEDAEFRLLMRRTKENVMNWNTNEHAQVLICLQQIEKA